jgi:hypothetical protein
LNISWNKKIGDDGAAYLHLIPDTVKFLNMKFCNLSSKGIRSICKFLEIDKAAIIGFLMWGNGIDDEGAKYMWGNGIDDEGAKYIG